MTLLPPTIFACTPRSTVAKSKSTQIVELSCLAYLHTVDSRRRRGGGEGWGCIFCLTGSSWKITSICADVNLAWDPRGCMQNCRRQLTAVWCPSKAQFLPKVGFQWSCVLWNCARIVAICLPQLLEKKCRLTLICHRARIVRLSS